MSDDTYVEHVHGGTDFPEVSDYDLRGMSLRMHLLNQHGIEDENRSRDTLTSLHNAAHVIHDTLPDTLPMGWCTYCHRQLDLTGTRSLPVHQGNPGSSLRYCPGSGGVPSPYPEHEKMAGKRDDIDTVTAFIEWVNEHPDWGVCEYDGRDGDVVRIIGIPELLSAYFGIDRQRISEEKQAMLDDIRKANKR